MTKKVIGNFRRENGNFLLERVIKTFSSAKIFSVPPNSAPILRLRCFLLRIQVLVAQNIYVPFFLQCTSKQYHYNYIREFPPLCVPSSIFSSFSSSTIGLPCSAVATSLSRSQSVQD